MSIHCPCGTKQFFAECCGPYLSEEALPPTPEALMRSRYTAFTRADIPYIMKSMSSPALDSFDPISFQKWIQHLQWEGLQIIDTPEPTPTEGIVEFVASYRRSDGDTFEMHERSIFEKVDDRWYYVDGEQPGHAPIQAPEKIGRNTPCPCASGRKYKKCCGLTVNQERKNVIQTTI